MVKVDRKVQIIGIKAPISISLSVGMDQNALIKGYTVASKDNHNKKVSPHFYTKSYKSACKEFYNRVGVHVFYGAAIGSRS